MTNWTENASPISWNYFPRRAPGGEPTYGNTYATAIDVDEDGIDGTPSPDDDATIYEEVTIQPLGITVPETPVEEMGRSRSFRSLLASDVINDLYYAMEDAAIDEGPEEELDEIEERLQAAHRRHWCNRCMTYHYDGYATMHSLPYYRGEPLMCDECGKIFFYIGMSTTYCPSCDIDQN